MNVITLGIRSAFRNLVRTFSIVIILGLSIGLSLIMLIANQAVDNKIKTTMHSIGNTVRMNPAGYSGSSSVNSALSASQMDKIALLQHITNLTKMLHGSLQTEGTSNDIGAPRGMPSPQQNDRAQTNLKSPFKLDCKNGACTGAGMGFSISDSSGKAPKLPDNFSLPIETVGTNNPTNPISINATSLKITSGQAVDGTKDSNDVMVSTDIAAKNNLTVGSTFTAYGQTLKVAAIFDSNTQAGDSTVIMSLPTLQRLSGQSGVISDAIATVDSLEHLGATTSAIKQQLGNSADVTSPLDEVNKILAPLQSVKSISLYSLVGSVAAGAVIILLTMVMIVRERKREIGIIKAIGSSNIRIMAQFMAEALTLTIMGLVVGLALGLVGGNPVTKTLVSTSGGTQMSDDLMKTISQNAGLQNVRDVQAIVGWDIILYGLGAALLIALIGSALSSFFIAKVKPAEVLRSE